MADSGLAPPDIMSFTLTMRLNSDLKDQEQNALQLYEMAETVFQKCRSRRSPATLENSIFQFKKALDECRGGPSSQALDLMAYLAMALLTRFSQTECLEDLEESIHICNQRPKHTISNLSQANHDKGDITSATAALIEFRKSPSVRSLNNAIVLYKRVLALLHLQSFMRPAALKGLSSALVLRFQVVGQRSDLDEAVVHGRQCLNLQPSSDPDPNRISTILSLSAALNMRYLETGDLRDLQEASKLLDEVLMGDEEANNLFDSACSLMGSHAGQDCAITLLRKVLVLRPPPHPKRSISITNLATALLMRFERIGQLSDLEESISLHRHGQKEFPISHLSRPISLTSFANSLCRGFRHTNRLSDLDESITCHREAVNLFPMSHPSRSIALNNFAAALAARYDCTDQLSDLENSISLHQEVLSLRPPPHPTRLTPLNNLATALGTRFEKMGEVSDIHKAIAFHEEALKLFPNAHLPGQQTSFASALLARFVCTGQRCDLDASIVLHRQSVQLSSTPEQRSSALSKLAAALSTRFKVTGQMADLDETLTLRQEALQLISPSHSQRLSLLDDIGSTFLTRFQWTGQSPDLEQAIASHRETSASSHPSRLIHLANALLIRSKWQGQLEDLEESITLLREVETHLSPSQPSKNGVLTSLAVALTYRFRSSGQLSDLEESIMYVRKGLKLNPPTHPTAVLSCGNLAVLLLEQFDTSGDGSSLAEAIKLLEAAVKTIQSSHILAPELFSNYARSLSTRFAETPQLSDIETCIEYHRKAYKLFPASHPSRPSSIATFAAALLIRFGHTAQLEDLEESVKLHQEALEALPASHTDHFVCIGSLANSYLARYLRTGRPSDLEDAVIHKIYAYELLMKNPRSPSRADCLTSLAESLLERFQQTRFPRDVIEAITLVQEAVKLCPIHHPHRPHTLGTLAIALIFRHELTEDITDLDQSISLFREAISLHREETKSPLKDQLNLSIALSARFTKSGSISNLDDAIAILQEVMNLTPSRRDTQGRQHSVILINLGTYLLNRFELNGDLADIHSSIVSYQEAIRLLPNNHPLQVASMALADALFVLHSKAPEDAGHLDAAVLAYRKAVVHETSAVSSRFLAAQKWASNAEAYSHPSALEAYEHAIQFLPVIAMVGHDLYTRQELAVVGNTLACDAASCAIRSGHLDKAVELLESGRAVFWSQARLLRPSLDDLHAVDPVLADSIQSIATEIEKGSFRCEIPQRGQPAILLEKQEAHFRRLSETWTHTIDQVRQLDGFQDFLRPQAMAILQQAASGRIVVILNASHASCDGIILAPTGVKHVPFRGFTLKRVEELVQLLRHTLSPHLPVSKTLGETLETFNRDLERHGKCASPSLLSGENRLRIILRELWNFVVRPIIDYLGLKEKETPPHVWWCPTGAFSFLPIHAAGLYHGDKGELETCTSDFAISSYIVSLTTLLQPTRPVRGSFKILAVAEPKTPNQAPLRGALDEIDRLSKHMPENSLTTLVSPESPNVVLSELSQVSIAHFACHGKVNLDNPLESALLLSCGELTIRDMMKTSLPNASLAFLSACTTATGTDKAADEGLHLAAAMQFAGFQGVVGTLWEMEDDAGPKVVDAFYDHLMQPREGAPDPTNAARALHKAIAELRQKERGCPFKRWVPFVHFGL